MTVEDDYRTVIHTRLQEVDAKIQELTDTILLGKQRVRSLCAELREAEGLRKVLLGELVTPSLDGLQSGLEQAKEELRKRIEARKGKR